MYVRKDVKPTITTGLYSLGYTDCKYKFEMDYGRVELPNQKMKVVFIKH